MSDQIEEQPSAEEAKNYRPPELIEERLLSIEKIRLDGNTQTRTAVNQKTVLAYAAEMKREGSAPFPPIDVFKDTDGFFWPADGLHRLAAAKHNGQTEIAARIYQGTRVDALMHSVNSNHQHGLPRTNADKRRCVELMLAEPEFKDAGNRQIARWCGVGDQLVAVVRRRLEKEDQVRDPRTSSSSGKRRGKDGKHYPAKKKPRAKESDVPTPPLPVPRTANSQSAAASADSNPRQEDVGEKGQVGPAGPGPEGITAEEEPVEKSETNSMMDSLKEGIATPVINAKPAEETPPGQKYPSPCNPHVAEGTTPDAPGASAGQQDWDEGIIAREKVEERLTHAHEVTPSDRYDAVKRELFCLLFTEMVRAINRSTNKVSLPVLDCRSVAAETAVAVRTFIQSLPSFIP